MSHTQKEVFDELTSGVHRFVAVSVAVLIAQGRPIPCKSCA